jgi:hypothetical protein
LLSESKHFVIGMDVWLGAQELSVDLLAAEYVSSCYWW